MAARAMGNTIFGLVLLAIGTAGCAETAPSDRAQAELQQARNAAWQKDQRIHALKWQMATLGQQVQATPQHNEAAQAELMARVQDLTVANAALADRLKKTEEQRAIVAVAPPADGKPRARAGDPARADDFQRLQASFEARSVKLADALARIEKLLQNQAVREAQTPRPKRALSGDLVDPWGFGERN
jgi:hypothetical protein